MKYRIKIANRCDFWLYTHEFEQLGEAIQRHIAYGFRDGSTIWHGIQITECADGKQIADSIAADAAAREAQARKQGYAEGVEAAAEKIEHFLDELTPEEWPRHGLCRVDGRFDSGWSAQVIPVLVRWVRALSPAVAEVEKQDAQ